ncbi:hypothetical protein TrRE_jg184, partial [Triparma retinervis]
DEDDRPSGPGSVNRAMVYWSAPPVNQKVKEFSGKLAAEESKDPTTTFAGTRASSSSSSSLDPTSGSSSFYISSLEGGPGGPSKSKQGVIVRTLDDSITGVVEVKRHSPPSAAHPSGCPDLDSSSDDLMDYRLEQARPAFFELVGSGKVGVKVNTGRAGKRGEDACVMTSVSSQGGDGNTWRLTKGAVFFAGNSTFTVEHDGEGGRDIVIHVGNEPKKAGPSEAPAHAGIPAVGPDTSVTPPQPSFSKIAVDKEFFAIGRSGEADYTVNDRELSRMHLAVRREGGGTGTLVDLGSTNGTYFKVGGQDKVEGREVGMGAEFVVGRTGFKVGRFEWGGNEEIGGRRTMEDKMVIRERMTYGGSDGTVGGPDKEARGAMNYKDEKEGTILRR